MTSFNDITADLATPGHRAAVVGVRELGHPVQGVRPARRAPRPLREAGRRRPGPPPHRAGPVGRAAHPVGPGRRLRRSSAAHAEDLGLRLGTINTNTFQDDDYKLGQPGPRRRAGAGQGHRPHARVRRHHGRHRQPRPQGVAARRHSTTRARATCATARTAWPTRSARSTPASATTSAWCSSTSSSSPPSTPPTSPTGARPTSTASALGERAVVCLDTGHHAPGTNIEFIVMQLLRLGPAGGVRLQLPLLRRRRPDRGGRRPVPAVPHPRTRSCGAAGYDAGQPA